MEMARTCLIQLGTYLCDQGRPVAAWHCNCEPALLAQRLLAHGAWGVVAAVVATAFPCMGSRGIHRRALRCLRIVAENSANRVRGNEVATDVMWGESPPVATLESGEMRLAEARAGPEARSLEDAPLGQRAELRSHLHSERQLEMAQLGKRMDLATIGLQSSAEPTHRNASPPAHGEEGEPKAHEPEVDMVAEVAQLGKPVELATIGLQSSAEPTRHNASPRAHGEEGEPKAHEPQVGMVGEAAQLGKRPARHRKQNSATR